jgi:polar amino acid transport system permease protein
MIEFITYAWKILPDLLDGAKLTVMLALIALAIGFVIGLPLAVLRINGGVWINRLVFGYLTLFRGTPLLVQLFIVYYGLPQFGINFSRLTAACITLGLHSSAYQAEYFRGAMMAVGAGQMKAARAIGMSRRQAVRYIILPQAFRLAIPAWSNEMVSMIKYTAVIFLIAVPDLMGQAKMISSRLFTPVPTYIIVAIIYLIMVGIASYGLHLFSKKLAVPGLSVELEDH